MSTFILEAFVRGPPGHAETGPDVSPDRPLSTRLWDGLLELLLPVTVTRNDRVGHLA